uniref:U3 small nucleolar RNA-associated protein 18 homolog n=1 Tax=Lepeophtheirus salmonis TaxID=72036 RepID=A0A0K2THK7_LEPSM
MSRKRKVSNMDDTGFYISATPQEEEDVAIQMETSFEASQETLENKRKKEENETVEKSLEAFLFGNTYNPLNDEESKENKGLKRLESSDENSDDEDEEEKSDGRRQVAWSDEDDDIQTEAVGLPKYVPNRDSKNSYSKELKEKFVSLIGAPKWADLDRVVEDEEEDFFQETTKVMSINKRTTKKLLKGKLEFRRMKDLNKDTYGEGFIIRSVEFHPSATVGLVSGSNGTVSLFQVDGKTNPKIQTINFENFPISNTHFSSDGNEFIASSVHHKHFFVYNMIKGKISRAFISGDEMENKGGLGPFYVSPHGKYLASLGRFGNIHFFEARSKEMIFTLKMNDSVRSAAFSSDGSTLYSTGDGGEVYIWDIRARDCSHRFKDDGALQGTSLALSGNNRLLATGSDSGIINIYERSDVLSSYNPKPIKVVKNLTTKITSLKFSPSSEILAGSSVLKDNAIKLIHTPSLTVFDNFPSPNHNYRRVDTMDFSLNGGYFSFGNNRGTAYLYRLQHYDSF